MASNSDRSSTITAMSMSLGFNFPRTVDPNMATSMTDGKPDALSANSRAARLRSSFLDVSMGIEHNRAPRLMTICIISRK